jgi:hypothetical protein
MRTEKPYVDTRKRLEPFMGADFCGTSGLFKSIVSHLVTPNCESVNVGVRNLPRIFRFPCYTFLANLNCA